MNKLKTVKQRFDREAVKWMDLLYASMAIAFKRYWGWGSTKINNVIEETYSVWDECANDRDSTMLQMLEDETGIEIRCAELDKSYHEVGFFNPNIDYSKMSTPQLIYIYNHMIPWLHPQLLGCILLGLHRKYGFGADRLNRISSQIEQIIDEYNQDVKKVLEVAWEEANFKRKVR